MKYISTAKWPTSYYFYNNFSFNSKFVLYFVLCLVEFRYLYYRMGRNIQKKNLPNGMNKFQVIFFFWNFPFSKKWNSNFLGEGIFNFFREIHLPSIIWFYEFIWPRFLKSSGPLWYGGVYRIQSLMANSLKVMWPLGVQSQNLKIIFFLYILVL